MLSIYHVASKVLILDSPLLQLSKDAYPVELYIRLKLHSLMRRLWTLQEGILAKDAYVQLADGTKKLREIDSEWIKKAAKTFRCSTQDTASFRDIFRPVYSKYDST